MMPPNPFDDLQESGIPMFGKNGTALSHEERAAIAKRKGLCLKCGTKTHQVQLMGRKALTNDNAYQGICIRCNNTSVPPNVLADWQSRNPRDANGAASASRFRAVGQAVRFTRAASLGGSDHRGSDHRGSDHQRLAPPTNGSVITAEVTPFQSPNGRHSSLDSALFHRSQNFADPVRPSLRATAGRPSQSVSDIPSTLRAPFSPTPMSPAPGRGIASMGPLSSSARSQSLGLSPSMRSQGTSVSMRSAQHLSCSIRSQPSNLESTPEESYKSVNLSADSSTLVQELQENRDRPEDLKSALHSLRNLGHNEIETCIPTIQQIIIANKDDPRLASVAIGALWGTCSSTTGDHSASDISKRRALGSDFIESLLDILHENEPTKEDLDTIRWTFGILSCLAEVDENSIIVNSGGMGKMIQALERREEDADVFESACRTFFAMMSPVTSTEDSSRVEQAMILFEEANGIQVVISAMVHHLTECESQCWALRLLLRIQDRSDSTVSSRILSIVNTTTFQAACVNLVQARVVSSDTFILSSKMLALLIESPENPLSRDRIDECIPGVLRLMGEKTENLEMQEACARILAAMARVHPDAGSRIAERNIVRVLISTMVAAPEASNYQEAAFSLLWVLAGDPTIFDFVSAANQFKIIYLGVWSMASKNVALMRVMTGFAVAIADLPLFPADTFPADFIRQQIVTADDDPNHLSGQLLIYAGGHCPAVLEVLITDGVCERFQQGLLDASVDTQIYSSYILASVAQQSLLVKERLIDCESLTTISTGLLTTASDSLASNLLSLISSILSGGSKKVTNPPEEMIQGILRVMAMFPETNLLGCSAIRNSLLATVPGFATMKADGLVDVLCSIVDDTTSSLELIVEACGACWAVSGKQAVRDGNEAAKLYQSLIDVATRNKGDGGPFNPKVLHATASALSCLLHRNKEGQIPVNEKDVDVVIAMLDIVIDHDVDNVVLIESLLDATVALCFTSKDLLIQCGVIVVVIDCMVEHETSEPVQQKGCAILALLASLENLQVNLSIAETDGIDMIVTALAAFTENKIIQSDACRALSHLSMDTESRVLILSQGGLILIVNAMQKYRDDVEMLQACCLALLHLSSDAEEQLIIGSNVVESVVGCMHLHLNCTALQERSLGVLQNISMRSKDAKRKIAEADGVAAVVSSIRESMGSSAVLERAFTTLWSLANLEENQAAVAECGGIPLVINGMMANIAVEKVQKQGCGCLCSLASNTRNKTLIRDEGGVDAIAYAMWAHYGSESLLNETCIVLSSLAINVHTNEVMIAGEGEINAILSAMQRFPSSTNLQENACVALRNFMLSTDNAGLLRGREEEVSQLMKVASAISEKCAGRARQVLSSLNIE